MSEVSPSLAAVRRELAAMRSLYLERIADSQAAAETGIVSLEVFARAIGLSPRTLKNDILSSAIARRLKWPEFRKCESTQVWLTTTDELRRWLQRPGVRSSHFDDAVADALRRHLR